MRRSATYAGIGALIALLAAFALAPSQANTPDKSLKSWQTGFWVWAGESPALAKRKPQVLYVQAQGRTWPRELPAADEYFVVRRIERDTPLTKTAAIAVTEDFEALVADAGSDAQITGLQIDYDAPTSKLDDYGEFLSHLRRNLRASARLSITALLDWFRPDTGIRAALLPVDEFVPQFYDAGAERSSSGIAAPIDAAKWAPIFNSFKTPYKIGASMFGRIARVRRTDDGAATVQYIRDATPLQFGARPEFRRSVATTQAGEQVVSYDVVAPAPDSTSLIAGDRVVITFPTEQSVRAAYAAASGFGEYCSGILFFRWPSRSETLALNSDEVRQIVEGAALSKQNALIVRDGHCNERQCADLYLSLSRSGDSQARLLEIEPTRQIEVFVPEGPLRSFSAGGHRVVVPVPAYSGLSSIYVGRVISQGSVQFELRTH